MYLELKEDAYASAETIGSRLGISGRMVRKHISILREAGLIVRVGSNKTGYWKVTIDQDGDWSERGSQDAAHHPLAEIQDQG